LWRFSIGKIPRKKRIKRIHIGEKRSSFPVSRVCEEKKKENHSRIIGWVLSANLCSHYKGCIYNTFHYLPFLPAFQLLSPTSGRRYEPSPLLQWKIAHKSNNMLPNCYKDCFLFYFVQLFQLIEKRKGFFLRIKMKKKVKNNFREIKNGEKLKPKWKQ